MTAIRHIATALAPVDAGATGDQIRDRFLAEPKLIMLAVVDEACRPLGVIERKAFLSNVGARSRKAAWTAMAFADPRPLVVEGAETIAAFLDRVLDDHAEDLGQGVIVVEAGRYLGVAAMVDLLRQTHGETARLGAQADEAHTRLHQALDAIPEGLAFFDEDDRLVQWNRRYAELHPAVAPTMKVGLPFIELLWAGIEAGEFPEAEGREAAWIRERLLMRTHDVAHEQALSDGRWLRIEERAVSSGGRINVLVDITDLKRREASFRLLFESNPVAMVVIDAETKRLLAVNTAAEAQYGYPREAVVGRRALDFIAPEDQTTGEQMLSSSVFTHRQTETRHHLTADGRVLDVLPYLQATSYGGRPAILAALIDVTLAKAAEAELERTRAFLDAVIETMPTMLLVKEASEHRYVMINRAGEDLLGVRREEILGKTDHDVFAPAQADFFVECDDATMASGDVHVIEDLAIQTRHKGERILTSKKVAMRGRDGRPDHILIICQDVTDRRLSIQALTEARDAAEAANRAKSAFLANMSHEIRTPLNGVIGITDILARTPMDPGQCEMVHAARSSAETLERLLSDVLDLARVESGRIELQREPFHLGDTVRDVARLCRPAADAKGVGVNVDIDPRLERSGIGDPVRVRQVLTNLASNAVKFTEQGEVRLRARPLNADGRVRFEVVDTGVGFDEVQKDRIFARFQQADSSITRRFGGTGLGLAISQELAGLMGAELDCDSRPGHGSTFSFEIDLPPIERRSDAQTPAETTTERVNRVLKVLLADDHPVNRQVVRLMLKDSGVDLHEVENGREACEAAASGGYDLILMDMQMPVMDGLSAVREIRDRETDHTPIIMLTANAMSEHVTQSLAAGADMHLGKPIRADALYAAIAQVLDAAGEAEALRRRRSMN